MSLSLSCSPGEVLNIAHRGASGQFPENIMAAFRAAVDEGADMIELDIQFSKDKVPVVFHDASLEAHSDGKGFVHEYTFEALKKLDAGSWYDAAFARERIPCLEEVLRFAKGVIALNIEIKPEAVGDKIEGGVEQKCLALVEKYNMQSDVLFSSFDGRAIQRLKNLAPDISTALLYSRRWAAHVHPVQLVQEYNADTFNCSYWQLHEKWLEALRTNNIPVFVYTVDDPARMKKLIKRGVNGIFTNRPDVLRDVINEIESER